MIKCYQHTVDGQSAIQLAAEVTPQTIHRFPGLRFHLNLEGVNAHSPAAYRNLVTRTLERHYISQQHCEERTRLPDCLVTRLLQQPSDETGWKLFQVTVFADLLRLEYSYSEDLSYQILLELGPDFTWLQCGLTDVVQRATEQHQATITMARELQAAPCSGLPGHGGTRLAHHHARVDFWQKGGNRTFRLDSNQRYQPQAVSQAV